MKYKEHLIPDILFGDTLFMCKNFLCHVITSSINYLHFEYGDLECLPLPTYLLIHF